MNRSMRGTPLGDEIPDELRDSFLRAEERFRRYFEMKVENPQQGTVEISGDRYISVRASSLSTGFFEIIHSLYEDRGPEEAHRVASALLFDMAHAIGKADARNIHRKMGILEPLEKLAAGLIHFAYTGWGVARIHPESRITPSREYCLIYDHPCSFEAEEWIKRNKQAAFPTCAMGAGYSSGWCEESFGVPLVATELECRAMGNGQCRFIMAPPDRLQEEIEAYGAREGEDTPSTQPLPIPRFFARKAAQDRFRIAAGLASDLVYEWNVSDDKLEWFGDVDRILGLGPGEFPRTLHAWIEQIHPEDRERLRGAVELHRTKTDPIHEEYRILRKDGTWLFWVDRGVPVVDDSGRPRKWIGVCTDVTERKRAENSLRESERRFREMAELLPEIVYEMDTNGTLTFVNKRAFEIFGYGQEDLDRGVQAIRLLAPEDRHRAAERVARLLAGEEVGLSEYTGLRKDGTPFPVVIRSTPILRDGRIEGVRGIILDMTAQRQATKAYRSLVEDSIQGLVIYQDSRAVLVNQAALTISGYSKEEVLAASPEQLMNIIHPEDRQEVWQRMQDRLEGKPVPPRYSYRILRKDGTECWVEINASIVEHAGRPAVQVSYFDVTEARRAEQELKESEERYRQLVENANDAIFVAQDGMMKFHNRKTEELSGYTFGELQNRPFLELIHPEDRDTVVRNHLKRLQGEEFNSTYSFRVIHKTGLSRWAQLNAALITWEGRPAVLCFIRDINEQKRLEEQVRQKQRLESIGTLAGGIAHDFNNMLAAITGFTELALHEGGENARIRSRLEEVLKAGKRARDLINQILTFSRQSDEERRPVRLGGLLEDCLNMVRASLPATIEIRREIETLSDTVLANPTQLHQVMINLFSNAAHAMGGEAGLLEVRLTEERLEAEAAGALSDPAPGSYLKLTVKDTGHGMEKAVADRVFDPFFTTKRPGEGTGMGLAVVHGIVKSHRGTISVQSERGKGTTFRVLLPRFDQAADSDQEPGRPAESGAPGVLFVDDEPALARLYEETLHRMGYRVLASTSPLEALEDFRKEPDRFDLVIADLSMPQLTGVDLAKELLAIRPDLPVLLCTGFSESVDAKKARALGIRRILMKPVLANDLAKAVGEALDSRESRTKPVRRKILIVEDDSQVREMIREVMEMECYEALEASDGKQGVRLFREEPADLVITDIFMPEADGLQTIREIRRIAPETRIIAISGGGKTVAGDFLHHAELFGANRVFSKPLVLSELIGAVRELLEEAEGALEPAA